MKQTFDIKQVEDVDNVETVELNVVWAVEIADTLALSVAIWLFKSE